MEVTLKEQQLKEERVEKVKECGENVGVCRGENVQRCRSTAGDVRGNEEIITYILGSQYHLMPLFFFYEPLQPVEEDQQWRVCELSW